MKIPQSTIVSNLQSHMSAKVERKRTKDLKILLESFETYATYTCNDEDGADDVKIIGEMEKQPFEKFPQILRLQFPGSNLSAFNDSDGKCQW